VKLRYYVIRRLLLSVLVVLGVCAITFVLARLVPSNPAVMWVGSHPTAEQIARAREELGLNQPLYVQFYIYMAHLFRGDFGISIRTHDQVWHDIATFLPASLELIFTGMLLAVVIGIPLGVISALKRDKPPDHATRLTSVIGVSIFTPWLGMMLQLMFFRWLRVLPVGERIDTQVWVMHSFPVITGFYTIDSLLAGDWIAFQSVMIHLILPAITLAAFPIGLITRMTRSTMVDILEEDYIRTAKSYGLSERVIAYKYALKNAIGPTITVLALTFAYSLVETFLIETVFNWSGLGRYAALSIISLDYPAIMGIAIVIAIIYVFLNLAVDIVQAYLDPRIRLE
jgi:peptide/nickel transport system permease protein